MKLADGVRNRLERVDMLISRAIMGRYKTCVAGKVKGLQPCKGPKFEVLAEEPIFEVLAQEGSRRS